MVEESPAGARRRWHQPRCWDLAADERPPRSLSIVVRFVLGGRHVANRFEQATRVEPIDPGQRREFDGLEMTPRALPLNHLCLEEADDRLRERVEAPMCQECC